VARNCCLICEIGCDKKNNYINSEIEIGIWILASQSQRRRFGDCWHESKIEASIDTKVTFICDKVRNSLMSVC